MLRVVCAALQAEGVASDIAPEVLESAASRIEGEMPDFLAAAAEKIRPLLAKALSLANFSADDSDQNEGLSLRVGRTRRLLQQAERTTGVAEIEYFVTSRNEWTTRRVRIDNVYETETGWYLEGECLLRRDHRMFKLENIRAVRVVREGNTDDGYDEDDPFNEEGNAA